MTPILIIIEPFNPLTGLRETVRVASAGSAAAFGLEGQRWHPALAQRPVFSIELMSPDLDGRVQSGRCRFSVDLSVFRDRRIGRWKWSGARVSVYSAPDLKLPTLPDFAGVIESPSLDLDTFVLGVNAVVDIDFLERPLLTAEFTGGGGLLGDAEKRGTLKPAGFGAVENIPPVWFDTTNWIGMVDGYGNTTAITRLMEGLNDFGARVADYASYDALKAAIVAKAIPPGRWGTCVAQGLVGLGAPPEGPITVNATFGQNRLGAIMQRILDVHAGVPGASVNAASFVALDAAVNRAANFWTAEQRGVRELLEAMAASVNATPLVTGQGTISITRAVASAAVATLDRSGRVLPRVTDWQSRSGTPPTWRLTARVARPASTVDLKDVNYVDDIIDRGAWAVGTVYRAGNIAWLSNKSSWLYIGALPTAGNAPPVWPVDANAYWQNLTPPALASDLTYADGTPIENLKPAAAGADPTAANVAAGIAGQAPAATDPTIEPGATVGAKAGTNLKDSGNQTLTDSHIKNTFVTILDDGTLNGGGGGKVDLSRAQTWERIAWLASGNVLVMDGTTVTKTAGINYTNRAIGPTFKGSCFMQFRMKKALAVGEMRAFAGLAFDPAETAGNGYANTYAFFQSNPTNTRAAKREGTTAVSSGPVLTDTTDDTLFSIFWSRGDVRFYRDGTLTYTLAAAETTMAPIFSATDVGATVWDMRCGPYDARLEAAVKGLGLDGKIAAGLNDADRIAETGAKKWAGETGANITANWTAAGIFGQAATATDSSFSAVTSVPVRLRASPLWGANFLDVGQIAYDDGAGVQTLKPAEVGANVTANWTAAGIINQAAIATNPTWANLTDNTKPSAFRTANLISGDFLNAGQAKFADGVTVEQRKPAELGANVTETRVASAITGQGPLAVRAAFGGASASEIYGFNPTFDDWTGTYPNGYSLWAGAAPTKSTSSLLGRYSVEMVSAGTNRGIFRQGATHAPLPLGTFVSGTVTLWIDAGWTGGAPGLFFDCHDATSSQRTLVNADPTKTGQWQTVPFVARARAGQQIIYTRVFLIPSSSVMNGGFSTGTVRFDSVQWEYQSPSLDNAQQLFSEVQGNIALTDARITAKSLANLDATANTKLGGIATGATVGGIFGTNILEAGGGATATLANFKTSLGIAGGITGQGIFATAAKMGSGQIDTYFFGGAITQAKLALDAGRLGLNIVRADGSTVLSDAAAVTSLGTAAGIAGQGSFATKSAAAWGSEITGRPGKLTAAHPLNADLFHPDYLAYTTGSGIDTLKPAELGSNVTANWTAAGIAGQAATATNSSFSAITSVPARLQASPLWGANYLDLGQMAYSTGAGVETLRPGEALANVTANWTAAGIAGQGPGATATAVDVLNYQEASGVTHINQPGGGAYTTSNGSQPGAIRISLPQDYLNTMIQLVVDFFNYNTGTASTYTITGYVYYGSGADSQWINPAVSYVGPETHARAVHFGRKNGKACIWIGSVGSAASYPKVVVRDVIVGHANFSAAQWKSGWAIAFDTSAAVNEGSSAGVVTVAKPRAGDAVFGEGVKEAAGGAIATTANFKTGLGTAAAIVGQAAAATDSTIEAAADVTKVASGPVAADVNFSSAGALTDSMPKVVSGTYKLTPAGGSHLTSGVTWAVAIESGTFTGAAPSMTTTSGTGSLTLNSAPSTPTVSLLITPTYGGKTYPPVRTSISKKLAAATSSGGGGSFSEGAISGGFSSGSFVAVSPELTVTMVGTTATLNCSSVILTPGGTTNGSTDVAFKAQWWNGSAWVDLTTTYSNPDPQYNTALGEAFDGEISCSTTKTGLTVGTSQKFRWVGAINSGITRTITPTGTGSVQG